MMKNMKQKMQIYLPTNLLKFILIVFILQQLICLNYFLRIYFFNKQISKSFLRSGIRINSFNPSLINARFNTTDIQFGRLTIIDNNHEFVQTPIDSSRTSIQMTLSNGYHHFDVILFDQIKNCQFNEQIEFAIGNEFLSINVIDENNYQLANVTVHLELVEHPHITTDKMTNQFGQVTFINLPTYAQVYIEAICRNTKRYAFIRTYTYIYQNLTLVLKDSIENYNGEID